MAPKVATGIRTLYRITYGDAVVGSRLLPSARGSFSLFAPASPSPRLDAGSPHSLARVEGNGRHAIRDSPATTDRSPFAPWHTHRRPITPAGSSTIPTVCRDIK